MEKEGKNGLLSIGKMAEMNRVSVATLRLYDSMGLLEPMYTDPQSGYRYYDIRQTSRLDIIRYMRELDMSLSDIRDILDKEDITLIEEKLIEKDEQIFRQMRELDSMHKAVQRTIQSIERYRKSPRSGTISLEYIDRRYILYTDCTVNFYEEGIVAYEKIIQELRRELMARALPQLLSYNLGTSVRKQDFENRRFIADKVFIFGDKHLADYGNNIAILESGMYACIYLDSFDDEIPCAQKLLEYCLENDYAISGDYICEEMTEFNVFDNRQRNMFLRLQIPVSFSKKSS